MPLASNQQLFEYRIERAQGQGCSVLHHSIVIQDVVQIHTVVEQL